MGAFHGRFFSKRTFPVDSSINTADGAGRSRRDAPCTAGMGICRSRTASAPEIHFFSLQIFNAGTSSYGNEYGTTWENSTQAPVCPQKKPEPAPSSGTRFRLGWVNSVPGYIFCESPLLEFKSHFLISPHAALGGSCCLWKRLALGLVPFLGLPLCLLALPLAALAAA